VNDGYYELFGLTPGQVFESAQDALFTVHPEDRESLLATCHTSVETGRVERIACRHINTRNGRQPWLEARIRHLGKAGLNDVFAFTFTDVTEQKEFEQTRTLKTYAMVLRGVYSNVFELNLTRGVARAVYIAGDQSATPDTEQPLDTLGRWLSGFLLQDDEELTQLLFTPGALSRQVRESASGYYLLERKVHGDARTGSWASFTFIRVPQDVGAEVYLMCIADVDSRKHADELLQENRYLQRKQTELAHYQSLMEHLGTSLLEWDIHLGRVSTSSGFDHFALNGFDFRHLTSHKDLEPYVYAKDLSVFRMFVNDLLAHGNAAVTLRLLSHTGEPVWCRVLCSQVSAAPGRAVRIVAAVNRIDEQMKIRESYLDEQTRFQAFSDNFLVGLGVYEVTGERQHIVYLSNGYRSMVGYDETEPLYDENRSFLGVHPDDIPRFEEATRELLRTGQPYTIEYRLYHKSGRLMWMRSRNAVYRAAEPGRYRIFAVIQDITELRMLRTKMLGMAEHMPAALAIYTLGDEPRTQFQTDRMAALAVQGSPVTLGADVLAQLRERFRQGEREVDEPVTLFAADGTPLPLRLLATAVPTEGDPLCYCALLSADG
jgi:PAS domain S-box-containing protein